MDLSELCVLGKSIFFSLFLNKMGGSKTDAEMLSHPPDVSIGLLSCNNLISQCHTSTGLWQHLMSVAVFSSVSNFMTSPIFYSMARSGLWTSNDNWEEKQCSAQLRTKSFCQEPKLWVYAYDCVCLTGDENNYLMKGKSEMFYLEEVNGWGTFLDFKQK